MPPQQNVEQQQQQGSDTECAEVPNTDYAAATIPHVDQFPDMEPLLDGTSALRRESFIIEFAKSKGPPQIVILCILLALGFGSTIGVVSGAIPVPCRAVQFWTTCGELVATILS
jgi:hypothetical protein